jgi:hypothetical protein
MNILEQFVVCTLFSDGHNIYCSASALYGTAQELVTLEYQSGTRSKQNQIAHE